MSIIKTITGLMLVAALAACGGGGGSASGSTTSSTTTGTSTTGSGTTTGTGTTNAATSTVASILVSAPSPVSVDAGGTRSLTITIRALDASSGLVKGAVLSLAANGNSILSASTVTTDATTGLATVTLTANSADQVSRVATVSVTCASCSASAGTLQVQIVGATLTVASSGGTSLTAGGNSITLSAAVKDSSGNPLVGKTVTFSSTDGTILGLGSTTLTNASGVSTVTVSGLNVGTANVNVSALGNVSSTSFTVSAAVGALSITSPTSGAVVLTTAPQAVTVSAPGATSFSFASTLGTFSPSTISGSSGTSTLTATQAGPATVTVIDNLGRTTSTVLNVSLPPNQADRINLTASQTTLGLATATSTPTLRLTARALAPNTSGGVQGVANVPILFTMSGGPGSGEYLTPAYQLTDGLGYAYADFYAGKTASVQNGIVVYAAALGTIVTPVVTGTPPSSNPVSLTVGGQAMSVAFGAASALRESSDKTLYIQDFSAQVTDSGGNAQTNTLVTLRLRPVAFSTGAQCVRTATYCSEDANGNGSLDPNEDGVRKLTSVDTAGSCATLSAGAAGTSDNSLTPKPSFAGAVPVTVTTDSTGTAAFSLTYLKAASIWVIDQLTATVSANGTESSTSTIFQLRFIDADYDGTPLGCHIPDSPFAR